MKKILVAIAAILLITGVTVNAADLVIDAKNQSFTESENKIKFDGDVTVSIDDLKVEGNSADVSMTKSQELDTATFYDKPYAYEVKKNKKREVKANILKVSLITKIIRAEGDTQSIVFDGKVPIVVINADTQEYDSRTGVMKADGAVTIQYKEIETFSNHATIMTDKNGDLKNIILIGNARVKEQNNESFADKFVYDPATEVLTATGNTTSNAIMEGGDKLVLKAAYQVYNKKSNIYNASGITESHRNQSNHHGMEQLINFAEKDFTGLCFLNLVDFDAAYGHRRDPEGYAKCLEEFDSQLKEFLEKVTEDDLVIITADHGNDPTAPGSDHTREYVPLLVYRKNGTNINLGTRTSFADIGASIAENFGLEMPKIGKSFLNEI